MKCFKGDEESFRMTEIETGEDPMAQKERRSSRNHSRNHSRMESFAESSPSNSLLHDLELHDTTDGRNSGYDPSIRPPQSQFSPTVGSAQTRGVPRNSGGEFDTRDGSVMDILGASEEFGQDDEVAEVGDMEEEEEEERGNNAGKKNVILHYTTLF